MDKASMTGDAVLEVLETRFAEHPERHKDVVWKDVLQRLLAQPAKLLALKEMERTGGEPDVIGYDKKQDAYLFVDCSAQSPRGRRNLCFDDEALRSRKRNPPKGSACAEAQRMGVALLDEAQYRSFSKQVRTIPRPRAGSVLRIPSARKAERFFAIDDTMRCSSTTTVPDPTMAHVDSEGSSLCELPPYISFLSRVAESVLL